MVVIGQQEIAPGKARKVRNAKSRTKKQSPNLAVARTFLDCFDGLITFQTFADQERLKRREIANTPENYAQKDNPRAKFKMVMVDPLAKIFGDNLDDHEDELTRLNAEGAGIFFAVNEMDGQGRRLENLKRVRAVWADLDGVPLPDQWPLAPSILVESSPGKFHVYWLFSGELELETWRGVMARLVQDFGADRKAVDPVREGARLLSQEGRAGHVQTRVGEERQSVFSC